MKEALLPNPENTFNPTPLIEETILIIEKHDEQWLRDPWEIKRRYFTTLAFLPHFDQYYYVYEQILIDTASIEFTHTLMESLQTNSPFRFSKAIIRNIMSISAWGIHPPTTRQLSIKSREQKFGYWDYIDTFSKAFYYQNLVNNHLWFFKICQDILKSSIPNWFLSLVE